MALTSLDAQAFFGQLETFSQRARQALVGKPDVSPWGEPRLKTDSGYPDGIVLHYTAGPTLESAVKWLCNTRDQCGSAHVVVADRRLPWADTLMTGLNLLQILPATCVQLRLPNTMAFHATVANGTHYGIEMANTGPQPPRDRDPTQKYNQADEPSNRVVAAGMVFSAYTVAQLRSVKYLGQYVKALGGKIDKNTILGHEHVQGTATIGAGGHDKRDPGVCFNYNAMRLAIVDDEPVVESLLQTLAERMGYSLQENIALAQSASLTRLPKFNTIEANEMLMAAQFIALGYHIAPPVSLQGIANTLRYFTGGPGMPTAPSLEKNCNTVKVFQRMMGLKSDGIIGPITQNALRQRVEDRWFQRSMVPKVA